MNPTFRERVARLERPLLLAGLLLVTLHLLDLALSGADTSILGVGAIVAIPLAWALLSPRTTRPTRLAAGVVFGLVAIGFGVVSHGLHVVNSGLDLRDLTGVGYIVGGLLLAASGLTAIAAPRRAPRRTALGWRAAHAGGWLAGGAVLLAFGVMPFAGSNLITHAPRWEIQESKLGIPHEEIRIATEDGRKLAAWYVPSRNGAAVLVSHGSGGSRGRVPRHVRMLARHGYGVLALDNPGNGESQGHSNGFGDNAQTGDRRRPRLSRAAPRRRARADRRLRRVAGRRGAARDGRPRPAPGCRRVRRRRPPRGPAEGQPPRSPQRVGMWITEQSARAVSGMKPSRSDRGVHARHRAPPGAARGGRRRPRGAALRACTSAPAATT